MKPFTLLFLTCLHIASPRGLPGRMCAQYAKMCSMSPGSGCAFSMTGVEPFKGTCCDAEKKYCGGGSQGEKSGDGSGDAWGDDSGFGFGRNFGFRSTSQSFDPFGSFDGFGGGDVFSNHRSAFDRMTTQWFGETSEDDENENNWSFVGQDSGKSGKLHEIGGSTPDVPSRGPSSAQAANALILGEEPVDSWYSEEAAYDYNCPRCSKGTGHFTQLVWQDSKEVGHGFAFGPDCRSLVVVANYRPAGNIVNRGYYERNVKPAH